MGAVHFVQIAQKIENEVNRVQLNTWNCEHRGTREGKERGTKRKLRDCFPFHHNVKLSYVEI